MTPSGQQRPLVSRAPLGAWERAYLAFETPEEEMVKFLGRLRELGVDRWDRQLAVVELFAGRGGGLAAWEALGFRRITGLDLSGPLASFYRGSGRYIVADARSLPIRTGSRDVVAVQGGLHHLENLSDLETVLAETCRILRPDGRILLVEPWLDGFLKIVHWICGRPLARRVSRRIDALATMIAIEGPTYHTWLSSAGSILEILDRHVDPILMRVRWGKLLLVGRPRARPGVRVPVARHEQLRHEVQGTAEP